MLACMIRDNKNIEGIKIGETELKISLMADDTVCFAKKSKDLQ